MSLFGNHPARLCKIGSIVLYVGLAAAPLASAQDWSELAAPDKATGTFCDRVHYLIVQGDSNFERTIASRIEKERSRASVEIDGSQCWIREHGVTGRRTFICQMHEHQAEEIGDVRNALRSLEDQLTKCLTRQNLFHFARSGAAQPRYSMTRQGDDNIVFNDKDTSRNQTVAVRLNRPRDGRVGLELSIVGNVKIDFMSANVGIRCVATLDKLEDAPQAASLITMIYGEVAYINALEKFLDDEDMMKLSKSRGFTKIEKSMNDPNYKILWDYAKSRKMGADALRGDLGEEDRWIAYSVKIADPDDRTFIPIPARFEQSHKTRLLLVVSKPLQPSGGQAELQGVSSAAFGAISKSIVPLFEIRIVPHEPGGPAQLTELDFMSFAGDRCWQIGR